MSIPPWLEMFQQQDDEDEEYEGIDKVKLMDARGRSFMWLMCKLYDASEDGVMGSACLILERCMSKKIISLSSLRRYSLEWWKVKNQMVSRIPLLASVCIALTTKMQSADRILTPKIMKEVLYKMHSDFSVQEINDAEIEVFSIVGFKVPLFTNTEKATMMAKDVGLSGLMLEGVPIVTELAECYRLEVQNEIISPAFVKRYDRTIHRLDVTNIRNMHFVAGALLATCTFLRYHKCDPAPRLAFFCRCEESYIKCIGEIIYNYLKHICTPVSRKRKRSSEF